MYRPAVHCDWSILAKLFFGLMNLSNEIDESFTRFRDSLFRPIGEMELSNGSRLAILPSSSKQLQSVSRYECTIRTEI